MNIRAVGVPRSRLGLSDARDDMGEVLASPLPSEVIPGLVPGIQSTSTFGAPANGLPRHALQ